MPPGLVRGRGGMPQLLFHLPKQISSGEGEFMMSSLHTDPAFDFPTLKRVQKSSHFTNADLPSRLCRLSTLLRHALSRAFQSMSLCHGYRLSTSLPVVISLAPFHTLCKSSRSTMQPFLSSVSCPGADQPDAYMQN